MSSFGKIDRVNVAVAPQPVVAGSIEVQGVSKRFGDGRAHGTLALADITLSVAAGEFVCLLGPSGCGKSTLLNMAAGFLSPDVGSILVGGRPVKGPGVDRCMLFQSPTLFPWLTAEQNVMFGPRSRGLGRSDVRRRCEELLEVVGLSDFGQHYPHQLSGGMQHRVAFARALINKPAVLLMDEPFGALDAITRTTMQNFLLELWQQERMTVLFVTHDVEEATLLADRVCVMSPRPGRVAAVVPVDIPRPRSYATTETPEFVTLKRGIREFVEGTTQ
jgi:NitT/TauT family transport system ATP-binding protein